MILPIYKNEKIYDHNAGKKHCQTAFILPWEAPGE